MNFESAAQQISPEIYQRFKEALELGKWPDGRVLTVEQKEICLQAIIVYETAQGIPEESRTGYVDTSKKKPASGSNKDDPDLVRILH